MPALYLFNKRTLLGGDDLHLPAMVTIATRLVQVFLLALPLGIWLVRDAKDSEDGLMVYLITDPSGDEGCWHSHYFPLLTSMHLLATVLFGFASIFLEHRIWHWTCQGTPTIREPRSTKIQLLLEFKFFVFSMFLFFIVLTFLSAHIFAQAYLECHRSEDADGGSDMWIGSHLWWGLSFLLCFSQVVEMLMIVVFLTRLFTERSMHHHHHHNHELSEEIISDRCHAMCKVLAVSTCCIFGGHDLVQNHNPAVATQNIYQQVAIALAEYLETRGTLDVVPTDLITGLLVLQKLQRQRILKARIQVIRTSQHQRTQSIASVHSSSSSSLNSGSNVKLRRLRTDCNSPKASAFSPQESPTTISNSNLVNEETSQLMTAAPEDQPQQLLYRRVTGIDSLHYEPKIRQVLDPYNLIDCERLQEGAHMAKYALAIYTWMLYVFVHPISGLPRIFCRSCQICCRQCGQDSRQRRRQRPLPEGNYSDDEGEDLYDYTVGDNICSWHRHALLLVAELDETDLVYAQFENRFSKMPYCILLDHSSQAVVISIRGSLTLEDLVTDAMIDPEPCDELGQEFGFDSTDQYCHAGVVACVQNIYQDLQRHRLLDTLLEEDFPNYQLRLVGHSLGAASATLLAYMLKPRYNNLKVVNFSPPGCTMTWDLATRCEEWTTTFVLDSDIVPRLSVLALEDLRDETLTLIGKVKVPKYQVFGNFFPRQWESGDCCSYTSTAEGMGEDLEQQLVDLNQNISEILEDSPDSFDTVYHHQLQEFLQIQEEFKRSRGSSRTIRMFPPGKMIHLVKTGEEGGCVHAMRKCLTLCMTNSGFQYTPIYIANDDLNEIVVSPTMGTDHFIDRMFVELGNMADQFGSSDISDGRRMS